MAELVSELRLGVKTKGEKETAEKHITKISLTRNTTPERLTKSIRGNDKCNQISLDLCGHDQVIQRGPKDVTFTNI